MLSGYETRLAAETSSVRVARRAVTELLGGEVDPETLEQVVLCTSEVVTNAIEHGAPPIDLKVARNDGHIRIEVGDASPLRPRPSDPSPTSVRGRGLLIVDRCASSWGVDQGADGKVVWFEFAV
jgi:anti-sigma regulatory factor (Ser/Thr protein kinase)